ncbi:MAG: hypothetical protein ACC707_13525 [Thiohalomonadales bacterium]
MKDSFRFIARISLIRLFGTVVIIGFIINNAALAESSDSIWKKYALSNEGLLERGAAHDYSALFKNNPFFACDNNPAVSELLGEIGVSGAGDKRIGLITKLDTYYTLSMMRCMDLFGVKFGIYDFDSQESVDVLIHKLMPDKKYNKMSPVEKKINRPLLKQEIIDKAQSIEMTLQFGFGLDIVKGENGYDSEKKGYLINISLVPLNNISSQFNSRLYLGDQPLNWQKIFDIFIPIDEANVQRMAEKNTKFGIFYDAVIKKPDQNSPHKGMQLVIKNITVVGLGTDFEYSLGKNFPDRIAEASASVSTETWAKTKDFVPMSQYLVNMLLLKNFSSVLDEVEGSSLLQDTAHEIEIIKVQYDKTQLRCKKPMFSYQSVMNRDHKKAAPEFVGDYKAALVSLANKVPKKFIITYGAGRPVYDQQKQLMTFTSFRQSKQLLPVISNHQLKFKANDAATKSIENLGAGSVYVFGTSPNLGATDVADLGDCMHVYPYAYMKPVIFQVLSTDYTSVLSLDRNLEFLGIKMSPSDAKKYLGMFKNTTHDMQIYLTFKQGGKIGNNLIFVAELNKVDILGFDITNEQRTVLASLTADDFPKASSSVADAIGLTGASAQTNNAKSPGAVPKAAKNTSTTKAGTVKIGTVNKSSSTALSPKEYYAKYAVFEKEMNTNITSCDALEGLDKKENCLKKTCGDLETKTGKTGNKDESKIYSELAKACKGRIFSKLKKIQNQRQFEIDNAEKVTRKNASAEERQAKREAKRKAKREARDAAKAEARKTRDDEKMKKMGAQMKMLSCMQLSTQSEQLACIKKYQEEAQSQYTQ